MTRVLIYFLVFGVFLPNLLFAKEVEYSGETLNISDTLTSDSIGNSGKLYVVEGTLISGNWEEVISAEIVVIPKTDLKETKSESSLLPVSESKIVKAKESGNTKIAPNTHNEETKPVISRNSSNSSHFFGNLSLRKSGTTPTSKDYQNLVLVEFKSYFHYNFYQKDLNDSHSQATPNYLLLFDYQIRPPPYV